MTMAMASSFTFWDAKFKWFSPPRGREIFTQFSHFGTQDYIFSHFCRFSLKLLTLLFCWNYLTLRTTFETVIFIEVTL